MVMNILNKEHKEQYLEMIFKDKGVETFRIYLNSLVKMYYTKGKTDYPFKQGLLLGLPMLKFAQVIESKEDLYARIKLLAQLLCEKETTVKLDTGTEMTLNLEGDKQ